MKTASPVLITVLLAALLPGIACIPSLSAADPIPGVDVVVEKVPPGNAVLSTTTDRQGFIVSRTPLPAGNYRVRGKSGDSASIKHRGGPVRWKLTRSNHDGKPIWSLNDASDPI